jgi:hypothetical protein
MQITTRITLPVLLIWAFVCASAQTVHRSPEIPKFMGREVTVTEPEVEDGMFPKGPATICVEGPPQSQCYTMPKDFGRNTKVSVLEVRKDTPALLFSADGGGVSGWGVHYALLIADTAKVLDNRLTEEVTVSNQSQTDFWNEPALSDGKIFVTADYSWGPDEGHYGEHRYEISAYVWKEPFYTRADRYVTSSRYDLEAGADVLGSERPEILARLKRLAAAQKAAKPN